MANRPTYPKRLQPTERIKAQWARRAKASGDRGYSLRWQAFWKRVVLYLQAREGWAGIDLDLVAEYVRRCRLVELHADEAEADPYPVNPDSGHLRAHPGWERSLAEAREARAVAQQLGLTPKARMDLDVDIPSVPPPPRPPAGEDEPDEEPEVAPDPWDDTQVGPDGELL